MDSRRDSTSRRNILQSIRSALRDGTDDITPVTGVPDDYRRNSAEPREAIVNRFATRVAEYRATVERVAAADLPAAIAARAQIRAVHRLVVPPDLPDDWLPAGIEILRDGQLSPEELDAADGVLTGCAAGIAETGTIILHGGAHQGRRAITLVPDYHLCVVEEDQIVDLVPEAIARLRASALEGRPITLISGPSATSDIELKRVEGVHGPRTLDVVIVQA